MSSDTQQQPEGVLVRPDGRPVKLKDSCDACGRSKVKCSREKPTCKRCATHGWTCEYGASHRTGRIPSKAYGAPPLLKPRPSTNDQQLLDDFYSSPPSGGVVYSEASNSLTPAFGDPPSQDAFSMSLDPWSGVGDRFSLLSPPASSSGGGDLDSFWPAYTDPMGLDGMLGNETFIPGQAGLSGPPIDPQGFPPLDFDEFRSVSNFMAPRPSNSNESGSLDCNRLTPTYSSSSGRSHGPGDGCLAKALALLPQLSTEVVSIRSRSTSPSAGTDAQSSTGSIIHLVIDQSRQPLRTIRAILECQCSQDEYIVSLLAVVVLKVIAKFTSAVHQTTAAGSGKSPLPAPQSVLDELRVLQDIVRLLTQRLRETRSRGTAAPSTEGPSQASLSGFSSLTVEQLELELQSRLEMVMTSVHRSFGY